jgi:hypothetical protein
MVTGKQDYDLYTDLKDEYGNPLYSMLSGSGGKMRVVEVYHYAPIQYLFNSSFGTNFGGVGGVGIPLGAFNSDTRFHILPLFEDVLRSGQLKLGGKVRRSHYNYKISGRSFRVFPVPGSIVPGVNDKVWIRVAFSAAPGGAFIDLATSGSAVSSSYYSATAAGFSGPSYGASNPANIPMGLIEYATLNQWAKNWIARMTLALATEVLGRTRRKVSRIPIPGSEVELDGSQLVTEAREDQEKLMEGLKEKLESLSYSKLQEQQATQAENLMKQLSFLPMPPTHTIRMFE